MNLRLTLYESERMTRDWLAATLERGGIEVCRSYDHARPFLDNLPLDRPDVGVADLRLLRAGEEALSLLREARERHPTVPLVVLCSFCVPDAQACYREGAAACIDVGVASSDELLRAVREVAGGSRLVPFSLAGADLSAPRDSPRSPLLDSLSPRELQVLSFIGCGADNLKISAHLAISERTVKSHVTSLYRKTNAENRAQLALLARELGLRVPVERVA